MHSFGFEGSKLNIHLYIPLNLLMTYYSDHVNNFEPLNLQSCQLIQNITYVNKAWDENIPWL